MDIFARHGHSVREGTVISIWIWRFSDKNGIPNMENGNIRMSMKILIERCVNIINKMHYKIYHKYKEVAKCIIN